MNQEFENQTEEIIEPIVDPAVDPAVEPEAEAVEEPATETGMPDYDYHSVQETTTPKKEKKSGTSNKWLTCICMAVIFGLVASGTFYGMNTLLGIRPGSQGANEDKKETVIVGDTDVPTRTESTVNSDVAKVAENVMPSVVAITNLSVQEVQNFFYGGSYEEEITYSGSGIIIGQNDDELLLVSNNHVVDGSKELTVTFHDGTSVEAYVKGADAGIDIAVLAVPLSEVKDDTLEVIKVAALGNSDSLAVGEPAIAIGNALGYGQSVTYGIISALGRELDDLDTQLIQTDAAINPGNSGGALLNANGEVVGINTAKVQDTAIEGMGYAIPISDVNDIINELMNRETRTEVPEAKRGTLGIQGISVSKDVSEIYGIPQGVQIAELIEGGAAQKAKLPRRGIITKFDGITIDSMEDLTETLRFYEAGEKVEVVVATPDISGEYEEKTYHVTLSGRSIIEEQ